jgi:hypothetical protein
MPRIAEGRSSLLLRGITVGAISATLFVIIVGLGFAIARNEQPFRRGKDVSGDSMDVATNLGIPVAAAIGSLIGGTLANRLWAARSISRSVVASPSP